MMDASPLVPLSPHSSWGCYCHAEEKYLFKIFNLSSRHKKARFFILKIIIINNSSSS
jgi:hypothetical protein